MKTWTKIIVLYFCCYSLNALAGYSCDLNLQQNGKSVSDVTVQASSAEITSGYLGTLFIEKKAGSLSDGTYEDQELVIAGQINGWPVTYNGQPIDDGQTAIIEIGRKHIGMANGLFTSLPGDQMILVPQTKLSGEQSQSFDFENSHLTVSCHNI